jgi:hypothetical protein
MATSYLLGSNGEPSLERIDSTINGERVRTGLSQPGKHSHEALGTAGPAIWRHKASALPSQLLYDLPHRPVTDGATILSRAEESTFCVLDEATVRVFPIRPIKAM